MTLYVSTVIHIHLVSQILFKLEQASPLFGATDPCKIKLPSRLPLDLPMRHGSLNNSENLIAQIVFSLENSAISERIAPCHYAGVVQW